MYVELHGKPAFSLLRRLPINTRLWPFIVYADYVKGFGGKFGVQTDRQDKCALGWDHQEKLHLHESQKGAFTLCSPRGLREAHFCLQAHVCLASRYLCRGAVLSSVGEASSVPTALEGPLCP